MKGIKKSISVLLSIVMAFCLNVICSAENNSIYTETIENVGISFTAEDILTGNMSDEDTIELNAELNYLPEILTYNSFQGSDYIHHSGTLTSDNAIDFF